MSKKGFTIIELITVISLLSIVVIILIPKINSAIKTSRADQLEEVREMVVKASDVYLDNSCGKVAEKTLKENDKVRVYLSAIKDCGLIEEKIYNPVSGNYFDINNEYVDIYIDEVGVKDYKLSF